MSILPVVLSVTICAAQGPSCLVVCPLLYRNTMREWADYRKAQGCRVEFYEGPLTCEDVRAGIRNAYQGGARYVLLIGDGAADSEESDSGRAEHGVPVPRVEAGAVTNRNPNPYIDTDHWYADLDDDGLPDICVGRLPVDTVAELSNTIRKIKVYEAPQRVGTWQRRVSVVAQPPGFGPFLDRVVEDGASRLLQAVIPSSYDLQVTYGDWQSPFCPDPRRFRETVLEGLNRGPALWIYIGHSKRATLPNLRFQEFVFPSMTLDNIEQLQPQAHRSVAIFLCCLAGDFSHSANDCLSEAMTNSAHGPVASIGAAGVAAPYGLATLATEIGNEYFNGDSITWGDLIVSVKSSLLSKSEDPQRSVIDAIAEPLNPISLAHERLQHVRLIHFFGDPLLRFPRPARIPMSAPPTVLAGSPLIIWGKAPFSGDCRIELRPTYDNLIESYPRRDTFDTSEDALASYQMVYRAVTCPESTFASVTLKPGDFRVEVDVPTDMVGTQYARLFLAGSDRCAVGAREVLVVRPTESSATTSTEHSTEAD